MSYLFPSIRRRNILFKFPIVPWQHNSFDCGFYTSYWGIMFKVYNRQFMEVIANLNEHLMVPRHFCRDLKDRLPVLFKQLERGLHTESTAFLEATRVQIRQLFRWE